MAFNSQPISVTRVYWELRFAPAKLSPTHVQQKEKLGDLCGYGLYTIKHDVSLRSCAPDEDHIHSPSSLN